jgi:hypothetical protein
MRFSLEFAAATADAFRKKLPARCDFETMNVVPEF